MRIFLLALWLGCLLTVIIVIGVTGRKGHHDNGRHRLSTRTRHRNQRLDSDFFLTKAALEGMGEIELSQIAINRSVRREVRDFAQQLLLDQRTIASQLRRIAQELGKPLPETLDPSHVDQVRRVRDLSSVDFDAAYLKFLVKDHRATVRLFDEAAGMENLEPQIKKFAGHFLPLLARRQDRLHNLQLHLS